MYEKIPTKGMDTVEWLKLRKSGIGGSDAGAVCGLDPICTNLTKMLASVTCLFSAFQQNNPQNTQERHSQKEDYSLAL